jgi:hypothetical protein
MYSLFIFVGCLIFLDMITVTTVMIKALPIVQSLFRAHNVSETGLCLRV